MAVGPENWAKIAGAHLAAAWLRDRAALEGNHKRGTWRPLMRMRKIGLPAWYNHAWHWPNVRRVRVMFLGEEGRHAVDLVLGGGCWSKWGESPAFDARQLGARVVARIAAGRRQADRMVRAANVLSQEALELSIPSMLESFQGFKEPEE